MSFIQLPRLFNQLDPAWKNDQHGSSSSTIGKTGCTISLLAAILVHAGYNETPKTVDDKLTANGGYSQGNLILWQVVPKIWPKLKWVYRHYSYNNDLAVEWIQKGMVPMIEVKADPIGGAPGGKHWVGFLGEKKSYDPWGGDLEDTKLWTATGMALYEYTPVASTPGEGGNMANMYKGYDLANPESMKIAVDEMIKKRDGIYMDTSKHEALMLEQKNQLNAQKDAELKKKDETISSLTKQNDSAFQAGLDEGYTKGKTDGYKEGFEAGKASNPAPSQPSNPSSDPGIETGRKRTLNAAGELVSEEISYKPKA